MDTIPCYARTLTGTPCTHTGTPITAYTHGDVARSTLPLSYDKGTWAPSIIHLCAQHTTKLSTKPLSIHVPFYQTNPYRKDNAMPENPDVGCECEIDWNCALHQGRYTALELMNDAASEPEREIWMPGDILPGGCSVSEYSNVVDWEPVICDVCGHALSDDEDVCPKATVKCGKCKDKHHTIDEVRACYKVKPRTSNKSGDWFLQNTQVRSITKPYR